MRYILILLLAVGCQSSNVLVTQEGLPAIELSCKSLGDTQLEIDYQDIRITCYGGKISDQASELVTDIFSAVVSAIVPVSAISSGFNALFGEEESE